MHLLVVNNYQRNIISNLIRSFQDKNLVWFSLQYYHCTVISYTKGVIRSGTSKDRQYDGRKKIKQKYKTLHRNQKTKDWATRIPLRPGVNTCEIESVSSDEFVMPIHFWRANFNQTIRNVYLSVLLVNKYHISRKSR